MSSTQSAPRYVDKATQTYRWTSAYLDNIAREGLSWLVHSTSKTAEEEHNRASRDILDQDSTNVVEQLPAKDPETTVPLTAVSQLSLPGPPARTTPSMLETLRTPAALSAQLPPSQQEKSAPSGTDVLKTGPKTKERPTAARTGGDYKSADETNRTQNSSKGKSRTLRLKYAEPKSAPVSPRLVSPAFTMLWPPTCSNLDSAAQAGGISSEAEDRRMKRGARRSLSLGNSPLSANRQKIEEQLRLKWQVYMDKEPKSAKKRSERQTKQRLNRLEEEVRRLWNANNQVQQFRDRPAPLFDLQSNTMATPELAGAQPVFAHTHPVPPTANPAVRVLGPPPTSAFDWPIGASMPTVAAPERSQASAVAPPPAVPQPFVPRPISQAGVAHSRLSEGNAMLHGGTKAPAVTIVIPPVITAWDPLYQAFRQFSINTSSRPDTVARPTSPTREAADLADQLAGRSPGQAIPPPSVTKPWDLEVQDDGPGPNSAFSEVARSESEASALAPSGHTVSDVSSNPPALSRFPKGVQPYDMGDIHVGRMQTAQDAIRIVTWQEDVCEKLEGSDEAEISEKLKVTRSPYGPTTSCCAMTWYKVGMPLDLGVEASEEAPAASSRKESDGLTRPVRDVTNNRAGSKGLEMAKAPVVPSPEGPESTPKSSQVTNGATGPRAAEVINYPIDGTVTTDPRATGPPLTNSRTHRYSVQHRPSSNPPSLTKPFSLGLSSPERSSLRQKILTELDFSAPLPVLSRSPQPGPARDKGAANGNGMSIIPGAAVLRVKTPGAHANGTNGAIHKNCRASPSRDTDDEAYSPVSSSTSTTARITTTRKAQTQTQPTNPQSNGRTASEKAVIKAKKAPSERGRYVQEAAGKSLHSLADVRQQQHLNKVAADDDTSDNSTVRAASPLDATHNGGVSNGGPGPSKVREANGARCHGDALGPDISPKHAPLSPGQAGLSARSAAAEARQPAKVAFRDRTVISFWSEDVFD